MSIEREWIGGLPPRMKTLPRDKRGFPVPAFVEWFDGEPNFAVMNPDHMRRCIVAHSCWICGDQLGSYKAFVIGPMCVVNRVTSEPPSHRDCATFAALNCPFLSRPMAKRADLSHIDGKASAGIMIERNPGVSAVWITKGFKVRREGQGFLFNPGDPVDLEFYAQGRRATRAEVDASVESGLPILREYVRTPEDATQFDIYLKRYARVMETFFKETVQ